MRFLFLLISCLGVFYSYADQRKEKREKISFAPKHEIFFGAGAFPLPANRQEHESDYLWNYSILHFADEVYNGPKYTSGAWFSGYSYGLNTWLNLCFSVSYSAYWRKWYEYYTQLYFGKEQMHYLGFAPAVRLTWLNRKYVRMYSTLGVGILIKWHRYDLSSRPQWKSSKLMALPEVSVIGISVGNTWYGFAEIGPSHHGALNVGMGYRFNLRNTRK